MSALLQIAKNKNDELVNIDDVPTGKKCECFCPYCGAELEARNHGRIREHHFKHRNHHACKYTPETYLHLLTKYVIQKAGGIMIPPSNEANRPSGFVHLENIMIEHLHPEYDFKPDVEGTLPDGRQLYIECLVSHKVSRKKRETIIENNLLCLEVNLNWLVASPSPSELLKYIANQDTDRYWIGEIDATSYGCWSGSISTRNPQFDIARDWVKSAFDKKILTIDTKQHSASYNTRTIFIEKEEKNNKEESTIFNLSDWGYDICEIKTGSTWKNITIDLLLYRSKYQNNPDKIGYIAISFRGRRRKKDAYIPKELRMIDIIIKDKSDEEIQEIFSEGHLPRQNKNIIFLGNWK